MLVDLNCFKSFYIYKFFLKNHSECDLILSLVDKLLEERSSMKRPRQ